MPSEELQAEEDTGLPLAGRGGVQARSGRQAVGDLAPEAGEVQVDLGEGGRAVLAGDGEGNDEAALFVHQELDLAFQRIDDPVLADAGLRA